MLMFVSATYFVTNLATIATTDIGSTQYVTFYPHRRGVLNYCKSGDEIFEAPSGSDSTIRLNREHKTHHWSDLVNHTPSFYVITSSIIQ